MNNVLGYCIWSSKLFDANPPSKQIKVESYVAIRSMFNNFQFSARMYVSSFSDLYLNSSFLDIQRSCSIFLLASVCQRWDKENKEFPKYEILRPLQNSRFINSCFTSDSTCSQCTLPQSLCVFKRRGSLIHCKRIWSNKSHSARLPRFPLEMLKHAWWIQQN